MVEIAKALALPRKPTTVISRHTFATVMKNAGASTEYIQEALGHHIKKTTEFHLDSFEKQIKKTVCREINGVQTRESIRSIIQSKFLIYSFRPCSS
jgi:integrase/recombinase XerD